jgi:hypothetical protein
VLTHLVYRWFDRYPSAGERAAVTGFLQTVPEREAAYEEMRANQKPMIEEVMDAHARFYPQFTKLQPQGRDKGKRDMELCVAFCANAMLFDDQRWLDNAWLVWYASILKAVHVTPQFMRDAFRLLDEAMKRRLSDGAYALHKPYFDHIAGKLCDIPEPTRQEVGERVAHARSR